MSHNTGITTNATELAALAIDGLQPAWMTLNAARERAFTGEIVFETDPEVIAYFDHGIVYYAERATDASLGRRLIDAGVLDVEQLDRGMVRVGDIEHLGRLFDRDPSVDRDAVVVVAESATQELIADLANRAITTVRVTGYRHHPSGVHRWFVAPLDPAGPQRPVSAVAQLDSTVFDRLPGLPFSGADELTIEWDEHFDDVTGTAVDDAFDVSMFGISAESRVDSDQLDADVFELSLDLVEFTDDVDSLDDEFMLDSLDEELVLDSLDVETIDDVDEELVLDSLDVETIDDVDEELVLDSLDVETIDDVDVEFVLDSLDVETIDDVDEELVLDSLDVETIDDVDEELMLDSLDVETIDDVDEAVRESTDIDRSDAFEFLVMWPDGSEEPATEASAYVEDAASITEELVVTEFDDGTLEFSMPPLELSDEPEFADADVPDDVADAVRRAIAAIESAGVAAPAGAAPEYDESPAVAGPAEALGEFAPPTMAMRAEVLYGLTDDETGGTADAAANGRRGVADRGGDVGRRSRRGELRRRQRAEFRAPSLDRQLAPQGALSPRAFSACSSVARERTTEAIRRRRRRRPRRSRRHGG